MAKKKQTRHASALKANRQSETRNARNRNIKKGVRLATRAVVEAAGAKDSAKVGELMPAAASSLDRAAQRGAIHWKTAARRKSRLAKRANLQLAAK